MKSEIIQFRKFLLNMGYRHTSTQENKEHWFCNRGSCKTMEGRIIAVKDYASRLGVNISVAGDYSIYVNFYNLK